MPGIKWIELTVFFFFKKFWKPCLQMDRWTNRWTDRRQCESSIVPSHLWWSGLYNKARGWTSWLFMYGQSIVLSNNHVKIVLVAKSATNMKMIIKSHHNPPYPEMCYHCSHLLYRDDNKLFSAQYNPNCSEIDWKVWCYERKSVINHSNQWIWNEQWTPFVPRLEINGQTGNNCWKL